jgi:perosamine synthetase
MIPIFKPFMADNVLDYLKPVLSYDTQGNMYIGQGEKVDQFEREFSKICGFEDDIISVNSGTSALELAFHLLNIKQGDEVITTPQTCTASQTPILLYGATIVWADIDLNGLIDPIDVQKKITEKTKAIIAVNWAGRMPDYKLLKSFGIPVIEDAAHGAYWSNNERGDYSAFSFQAIKALTTGDGGALLPPKDQRERAKLLRWFGLDRTSSADFRCAQNIQEYGRKLHMTDIDAAIGLANLSALPYNIAKHQDNARYYQSYIKNDKIQLLDFDTDSPYWLYTMLVDQRDRFIQYLKDNGIASSMVHARNDKHVGFQNYSKLDYLLGSTVGTGLLPGVDYFDSHQVNIPVGWWITEEEREKIVKVCNAYTIN